VKSVIYVSVLSYYIRCIGFNKPTFATNNLIKKPNMKIKKLTVTGITIALLVMGFASISIAQDKKSSTTETKSSTTKKGGTTTTTKKTVTKKANPKKKTTETQTTTKTDKTVETNK
jgi:hypothetical protein